MNTSNTDKTSKEQKSPLSKKEVALAALALLIIIGFLVAAVVFRQDLAKIEVARNYSLIGVFVITFLASGPISATAVPIPYIVIVFTLPGILAQAWGPLAPILVAVVAAIGATLGETFTFMIGYGSWHISKWLISRINEKMYQKAGFWVKKYGPATIFAISAVPNPAHLPMTFAVGALKFSPPLWFLLSLAGNLVKYLYIAFAGYFGVNFLLHWLGA